MLKLEASELLKEMDVRKASDIVLSVGARPQFRINGLLMPATEYDVLTPTDTEEVAFGLMSPTQIETLMQDKVLDFAIAVSGQSRYRVNVFMQRGSIALAIRAIPLVIPGFDELGLPPIIREFALEPHGLLLVTGPAGSGKSTTLAAMIDYINEHKPMHVITIEDPIEYQHQNKKSTVEQREVGIDTPSFQSALRAVFRQTPDVIMIGEMRDLETMQLALSLAETGHLILATLHTQDATHSIHRIVDTFPPYQQRQIYIQLSMVLLGVVSQQLLITTDRTRRVLACEIMCATNAVRNLIREMQVQHLYSVIQTGQADGMKTMNASVKELCDQGLIDQSLGLQRTTRKKELQDLLENGSETRKPRKPSRRR